MLAGLGLPDLKGFFKLGQDVLFRIFIGPIHKFVITRIRLEGQIRPFGTRLFIALRGRIYASFDRFGALKRVRK